MCHKQKGWGFGITCLQRNCVVRAMQQQRWRVGFWFTAGGELWCYLENWLRQEGDELGMQKGSMPLIFRSNPTCIYFSHIPAGWPFWNIGSLFLWLPVGSANGEKWQEMGVYSPQSLQEGPPWAGVSLHRMALFLWVAFSSETLLLDRSQQPFLQGWPS